MCVNAANEQIVFFESERRQTCPKPLHADYVQREHIQLKDDYRLFSTRERKRPRV
jgi:hypothetical protein